MTDARARLRTSFDATVQFEEGRYVVEMPFGNLEGSNISDGDTVRLGVFTQSGAIPEDGAELVPQSIEHTTPRMPERSTRSGPPVQKGEIHDVKITAMGDEGDGIGRVDGGYVVIVPGTDVGDEVVVEIENATKRMAFGRVRGGSID